MTVGAVVVDALILAAVFRIATATRLSFNAATRRRLRRSSAISADLRVGLCRGCGQDSSAAYGTFAIVLGLLAWIFFAARRRRRAELIVGASQAGIPEHCHAVHGQCRPDQAADVASTDAAVAQRHAWNRVVVTFHPGLSAAPTSSPMTVRSTETVIHRR